MGATVPEFLFSESEACNFIPKETLEQMFSCEFCEITESAFSLRKSLVAASVMRFAFKEGEALPSKRKWSYF